MMVAADLEAAEQRITDELGLELCYRDPGVGVFGLRNALFPIGDKLLEVVSPTQEGTTAGRFLDKRGGDGGYMVIFAATSNCIGIRWSTIGDERDTHRVAHVLGAFLESFPEVRNPSLGHLQMHEWLTSD